MLRARYSTSAGQTLVIASPAPATLVQVLPTFFCHWNVTGPVAFVTLALTTLDWLCVTTGGVKTTATAGCRTVSSAASLHALVELKLSTARTRNSMLEGQAKVVSGVVNLASVHSGDPSQRHW